MTNPSLAKKNKVAIYAIGEAVVPSTRFRMIQFLPSFEAAGFEVKLFTLPPTRGGALSQLVGLFWQGLVRWAQLAEARRYDLLIIQKGLTSWRCKWLVDRLFKMNVPYIVDIDDAVHTTNIIDLPAGLRWLQDREEPAKLLKYARHVVAGNRFLEKSIHQYNPQVSVIPTVMDTEKYAPTFILPHKVGEETGGGKEKLVIGWSGSESTNIYINLIIPTLNHLAKKYDFEFLIMSKNLNLIQKDRFRNVNFKFLPWKLETEIEDLKRIDIGIMPLPNDEWAQRKCGAKALLYMSLGLPSVSSAVGVSPEIIQDGVNGFLASKEDEWVHKLGLLLENPDLRKSMGMEARKTAEEKYSVKSAAPQWINLICDLIRGDENRIGFFSKDKVECATKI